MKAVFDNMRGGLNLHALARPAVALLHPEVEVSLYRSQGQSTTPDGKRKSHYAPGEKLMAQVQSEGSNGLRHTDQVARTEISRKFYLFSPPGAENGVAALNRPLARGGDLLLITTPSQTLCWLVEAVLEDFSNSNSSNSSNTSRGGWVSVRAVLQHQVPDLGVELE